MGNQVMTGHPMERPVLFWGETMDRLRRRREFLAVSRSGVKSAAHTLVLLERDRRDPENPSRIGYTVTRKIGGAVVRNRVRRRLREAVRLNSTLAKRRGRDYVVIARQGAVEATFDKLCRDLDTACRKLSKGDR